MSFAIKLPVLSVCVLFAASLTAKEYIIEAPDGVGDVVALTNAFAELNKANTTGAKILLKPGIYDLSGTMVGSGGSHFRLDKKMKGGLIAGLGDSPSETIIKGGGEKDKLRIFHFWSTDPSDPMVVSNLTLTGGYSNSDGGAVFGSVDNYGGNLILSHLIVSNNYAKGSNGAGGGGAIHVKAHKCLFASNVCGTQHGGGVVNYANVQGGVWDCVFSNNIARADKNGGGLYVINNGTVSNCTFIGNSTAGNGGGLYFSVDGGTCFDCTFEGNYAQNGAGAYVIRSGQVGNGVFKVNGASSYGGGLYVSEQGICLDSTFEENNSANGGGVYASGTSIVSNGMFRANAASSGGGLYISANAHCIDSTIEENSANMGCGAYVTRTACVERVAFMANGVSSSNGASIQGGGAYLAGEGVCDSCSFVENFADSGGGVYVASSSAAVRGSCFEKNRQEGWKKGAALFVNESDPLAMVSNCVFNANESLGSSGKTIISNAELVDCVITNHHVEVGYVLSGCNMIRCLFAYNSSTGNGQHLDVETFYGTAAVSRTNINCVVMHNKAMGVNSITDSKQVINCTYYGNYCDSSNYGTILRGGVAWNTLIVGNRISSIGNMDVRRNFHGGEVHQPYLTNCVFSASDIEAYSFGLANCKKVTPFAFYPTADGGEYDIKKTSPAFNAGVLEEWMLPLLGGCDFAKRQRIKYDTIDVGALECQFAPPFAVILR